MSTECVSLEKRVARIEARNAIVDLLTEYTLLVDQYDIDLPAHPLGADGGRDGTGEQGAVRDAIAVITRLNVTAVDGKAPTLRSLEARRIVSGTSILIAQRRSRSER